MRWRLSAGGSCSPLHIASAQKVTASVALKWEDPHRFIWLSTWSLAGGAGYGEQETVSLGVVAFSFQKPMPFPVTSPSDCLVIV